MLAQLLKDCPGKSITMQFDTESSRYVVAVDGDAQEITRARDLIQALQVASEALIKGE